MQKVMDKCGRFGQTVSRVCTLATALSLLGPLQPIVLLARQTKKRANQFKANQRMKPLHTTLPRLDAPIACWTMYQCIPLVVGTNGTTCRAFFL